jgi:HEAT repeat protein
MLLLRLGRLALLFLPVTLLLGNSLRSSGEANGILWMGTAFQTLACLLALASRQGGWREPLGSAVIMLYVIALSWLVLGSPKRYDWFLHLSQALLLVVPLAFFALQCLRESGAPAMRRARQLAARLASRRDWPADLQACRLLPEVKALRESLHLDAVPALALLSNARPQVRVAALASLEFRQNWRPGQAEIVLTLAQRAQEPEVRAAAVFALANLDDRVMIEGLAEFLHDPSRLVRQTAAEALLWNTEDRWSWIRYAVRNTLADPACQQDGPLCREGILLTAEAVADLTAWSTEKGLVALRAAQTLGMHYGQALVARREPGLVDLLRTKLIDAHTPPMLRLELARLLHHHRELDREAFFGLLDPSNPAPLRLIAVEALLNEDGSESDREAARSAAVAALHDLARLPNREIALATAEVVHRRLGVNLGLPRGQAMPPVQSRQAAEIARRVLLWAAHQEVPGQEAADGAPGPTVVRPQEPGWRSLSEM